MNKPCVLLVDAEELVRAPLAQYLRELSEEFIRDCIAFST